VTTGPTEVVFLPGGWLVRRMVNSKSVVHRYRCPGCQGWMEKSTYISPNWVSSCCGYTGMWSVYASAYVQDPQVVKAILAGLDRDDSADLGYRDDDDDDAIDDRFQLDP
jgi:hypothetical protein